MKRSSFLQTLCCAVALSAMDVMGLVPAKAPGIPKALVETLWQRLHYMDDGKPFFMFCVSNRHPDELTEHELRKGMEEGEELVRLHNTFPSEAWKPVIHERIIPMPEGGVCVWEDIKP